MGYDPIFKKVIDNMTFECPVCGFTATTLTALKTHFKRKHKYIQYCPICDKPVKDITIHCRKHILDVAHATLFYLACSKKANRKTIRYTRSIAYSMLSR